MNHLKENVMYISIKQTECLYVDHTTRYEHFWKKMQKQTSDHNSQGGRWNEPKFGTPKFLNNINICANFY